jgi:hypothetical protein
MAAKREDYKPVPPKRSLLVHVTYHYRGRGKPLRYDDDPVWNDLFARSQHVLEAMAEEALEDVAAGRTEPMDVWLEGDDDDLDSSNLPQA